MASPMKLNQMPGPQSSARAIFKHGTAQCTAAPRPVAKMAHSRLGDELVVFHVAVHFG
jgi:hypothetical protein